MTTSTQKTMESQTSTFHSFTDTENTVAMSCIHHGPYFGKQMQFFNGRTITTTCPKCNEEKNKEQADTELLVKSVKKQRRIEQLLGNSGIPKRFISRTFVNYKPVTEDHSKALQVSSWYANHFDKILETGASLIFCGKPGTGKTHLATAIANAVCNQGRVAVFMSVLKATRLVKDTWKKDSDSKEDDVYKTLITPDLLILDEVGMQFGSDSEKIILFEILNGRYENVKPTIVISNLSPTEITTYLGERVIDRLKEGGGSTVVFNWDSYRENVLKDTDLPKTNVKKIEW